MNKSGQKAVAGGKAMKKNRSGFTLIELLVVVLIIGILASIAIPQYFKVVEKSRMGEAMSVISAMKSAQERYMASNGVYTGDFTKLDIAYPNMTSAQVPLKYFNVSATIGTGSGGIPDYQMDVTRHTGNTSVAPRYGTYVITVNVPFVPIPAVSGCPGGTGNCDELLK